MSKKREREVVAWTLRERGVVTVMPMLPTGDDVEVCAYRSPAGGAPPEELRFKRSDLADHRRAVRIVATLLDWLQEQGDASEVLRPAGTALLLAQEKRDQGLRASLKHRNSPKGDKVRTEIAKMACKGRDPMCSVGVIARNAGCTESYVRQILSGKESRK